jgi:hypothetical protein
MRTLILLAFLWFGGGSPLTYTVSRNADPVVGVAVEMLQDTLTLSAVDDHIIFDQWMIDYDKDRPFYIIPVSAK